jgi:hypothetical protein
MSVGARLGRTVALALLGATLVSGGACSSRRHKAASPAVLLPPEDAYRSALEMIEARKLRKAKTTLENVQYTAESRGTIEPLVQLVLADLMFFGPGDVVSLIEARSKYLDFVTLYGEHPKAPYAQYQAGVCSLRQVAHATRDQTQTQTAISDFLEVTRRYPDSPYAIAARISGRAPLPKARDKGAAKASATPAGGSKAYGVTLIASGAPAAPRPKTERAYVAIPAGRFPADCRRRAESHAIAARASRGSTTKAARQRAIRWIQGAAVSPPPLPSQRS